MLGMDIRLFWISTRRSFSISLADFRQPSFTNPFTLHRLLVQKELFFILSRYGPSTSTTSLTMAAVSELVVIWNCCVRSFILNCHPDIHFKNHATTHCYCYIASLYQEDLVTYSLFRSAAVGNQTRSILQFDSQLPQKILNLIHWF